MPTVIATLDNAPTNLAPASKGDSFSYVHGPGIDDHRSRGRLGGDCHRQPAGRDERERASQLFCMTTTSGSVYYHHDGLGSTVVLTDTSGNTVESYTYDVFGTVSIFDTSGFPQSSSTAGNRFLYTGREFVKEVNLYDYRNRVYSAEIGRFLQTDPIQFDAGDVNLYRYVGNDPANFFDPLGLAKKQCCVEEAENFKEKSEEVRDLLALITVSLIPYRVIIVIPSRVSGLALGALEFAVKPAADRALSAAEALALCLSKAASDPCCLTSRANELKRDGLVKIAEAKSLLKAVEDALK
jgi:RHS repeat-associated protein